MASNSVKVSSGKTTTGTSVACRAAAKRVTSLSCAAYNLPSNVSAISVELCVVFVKCKASIKSCNIWFRSTVISFAIVGSYPIWGADRHVFVMPSTLGESRVTEA